MLILGLVAPTTQGGNPRNFLRSYLNSPYWSADESAEITAAWPTLHSPSALLAVLVHVHHAFVINLSTAFLATPSDLEMLAAEDQLWPWLSSRPLGLPLCAPLEQQSCSRLDLFS